MSFTCRGVLRRERRKARPSGRIPQGCASFTPPHEAVAMNPAAETDRDKQSFAETALRLGGKGEEEARRLGAVDKADEQVETLFAPQYQTASSPVHRAVWDAKVPLDLFMPSPLSASAPCDAAMEKSLAVV